MPLEDDFDDTGFHAFAVAVAPHWHHCPHQQELLAAVGGDLDMAVAMHYHLGDGAFDWLDFPVPIMGGVTPRQCLATDLGRIRIKACLWRMN